MGLMSILISDVVIYYWENSPGGISWCLCSSRSSEPAVSVLVVTGLWGSCTWLVLLPAGLGQGAGTDTVSS